MAGRFKRPPVYFSGNADGRRYAALSKADWADAYVDLYRQVFGEDSEPSTILSDVEHRVENLRRQGIR